jgi:hypothetical protein
VVSFRSVPTPTSETPLRRRSSGFESR